MWWIFERPRTLWACFWAFGVHPNVPEMDDGLPAGMLGNLLPLPGGVGGVEGGMVGAPRRSTSTRASRCVACWPTARSRSGLPALPGVVRWPALAAAEGARSSTSTRTEATTRPTA
jgi:hypothetical protein